MKGKKGKGLTRIIGGLLIVILAVGLLTEADAVGDGIRSGLQVSAGVLVPSLFPFMVLSGFLSLTHWGAIVSRPFGRITTRIFKLPEELGVVVVLGMIGGYPVGAKAIADLLARGKIDTATAQRMLCFCVNAGPSFLITAVGTGMLMNQKAGIMLFLTQITASLLIGAVISRSAVVPPSDKRAANNVKPVTAFVQAVTGAASGVITLCAFAVLFSGILSLINQLGVAPFLAGLFHKSQDQVQAVLGGFLEVTSGCIASARIGGSASFLLVSMCCSFCGLSVIFQIMSCFQGQNIRFSPFIASRVVHMILASVMSFPFYRILGTSQTVWLPENRPQFQTDYKTVWISICLLAMCTILLLSTKRGINRNK